MRVEKIGVEGFLHVIDGVSFGESILEGKPLTVPAQDAVDVQRIIEAAYISNDEKRLVDL